MGASAEPTGLSQAEPEVSALRASIPSAALSAFSYHWEKLGSVASRLGRNHGNGVIAEARMLRAAGLVESRMIGGNLSWRRKPQATPGLRAVVAAHRANSSRWSARLTGSHEGPNDIAVSGYITTARDLRAFVAKLEELAPFLASAIETGTAKTEGLGPKDESAVAKPDAPERRQ